VHRRGHAATAFAILVFAALARSAFGDPAPATPPPVATSAPVPTAVPHNFLHISVPWHLSTDSGTKLDLPPGYVLDEPSFSKLDIELKRLQDVETRLTAANASLVTATSGWTPGWWTLATVTLSSIAAGWYLHEKI
jgi:hypothetical protein